MELAPKFFAPTDKTAKTMLSAMNLREILPPLFFKSEQLMLVVVEFAC